MTKSGGKVPSPAALRRAEAAIRKLALSYPATSETFPWGHSAFKVAGKTFLFLALEGPELSLSAKLPRTGRSALALPYAAPTEYGLGKSGWVTGRFGSAAQVPLDALAEWIAESYRAVAPKRIVEQLATVGLEQSAPRPRAAGPRVSGARRSATPARKTASKRSTKPGARKRS